MFKKTLIILISFIGIFVFAKYSFAAEIKKTICASGCDYTSLSASISGEAQDLVAGGNYFLAEIQEGLDDTTPVDITGWNTGASNYIYIYTTSAARHAGTWNENKYILSTSDTTAIDNNENYVRVEGLQIKVNSATTYDDGIVSQAVTGAGEVRIWKNIVKLVPASGSSQCYGIFIGDTDFVAKIWNNIVYDFNLTATDYRGIWAYNSNTVYIYNNTVYNSYRGIEATTGTIIAINNIANEGTDGFVGTFDATSDYNASDIAGDAPGTNSRNGTDGDVTFANEAGDDFRLATTDTNARGKGLSKHDDANCPVIDDLEGHLRRNNGDITDIGADEDIDTLDGTSVRLSTIKESGGTFSSLSSWEAAEDGDITNYYPLVAQIDGSWSSAEAATLTIDGSITDATHYIRIYTTTTARHDGKWNTNAYRIVSDATNDGHNIAVLDPYVRIEGLQIEDGSDLTYRYGINITETNVRVAYNIVRQTSTTASNGGIRIYDTDGTGFEVYNNIVYNFTATCIDGVSADSGVVFYNNTAYGCNNGFTTGYLDSKAVNNISYNNTTDDYDIEWAAGSDYNMSEDATAPGANSKDSGTGGNNPVFVNTGSGTEDFHIQSTSDAIGVGTDDPGAGLYSDDIDGETRTSTWDMGADEAAPSAPIRIKSKARFKGGLWFK